MSKKITTGIKTVEEFIKRARIIHGNTYDYSLIKEYKGANIKVPIIDKKYGIFYQTPYNHLRGFGTRKRYIDETENTRRNRNFEIFVEKAKKIHGDIYDYSKSNYIDIKTKILIIDREYGEFLQIPEVHLRGHGHPFRKKISCGEFIIENFLKRNLIKYERQKSFPDLKSDISKYKLRYDFFLPEFNIVIEYNGIQHYNFKYCFGKNKIESFEKTIYNDNLKKKYAEKNNFKYIEISYKEKEKITEILEKYLSINNK